MSAGGTRQQAIDAIAEALGNSGYLGGIVGLTKLAEAAHDAVEPLIRADQRERDARFAQERQATSWDRTGVGWTNSDPDARRVPLADLLRAQP